MNKKKIILIAVIILIIVGILCLILLSKKKLKNRDYELLVVSDVIYYPLEVQGKYGVINKDGTIIIQPQYDEVQITNPKKTIFIVKEGEKYKTFDTDNNELFTNYDEVTGISRLADYEEREYNTTVLKYKENGKYGLLGLDGQKITDAKYDEMTDLTDKNGEILVKENNKYGVINVNGVQLVQSKYDYIKGDGYSKNSSYKDGGYIVGNKGKSGYLYGYLDKNENEIVKINQEVLYRVTEIDSDDTYLVCSENGRYALYKGNNNLTSYKYIDINYNNGTETFTVQKNKSFGLINLDGKVIIPEQYDELLVVGIFVKASKDGIDYTFDLNGKIVENLEFASLQKNVTDKFYISIDDNYKYGVTDKDRKVVIENIYDYIEENSETGLLIATAGNKTTIYSAGMNEIISVSNAEIKNVGKYIQVTTKDDLYFLTAEGKKVDNKTVYLDNQLYTSKNGSKWGFVDLKDRIVIPYEYDEVTEINEFGFAGIKKKGKWGVINKNGEIILEPTYESDDINPIFIGKYCLKNGVVRDYI